MTLPLSSVGPTGAAAATGLASRPAPKTDVQKAAEGFERLLTSQLTKELVQGAMPLEGASAASGTYAQMLPDALTEALMSAGGIGLAKQLEEGLR